MTDERDLSSLLPEAPPPRPAARRAAIETAMQRFDGAEPTPPRPAPPQRKWLWPQIGALATAGLVGVVSVSLWQAKPPSTPVAAGASPASKPTSVAALPADNSAPTLAPTTTDPTQPGTTSASAAAPPPKRPAMPHPPQRAEAPPIVREPLPIISPPAPPAPPPPVAASHAPASALALRTNESADTGIVVTGSRMVSREARARATVGDWNACTVDDPRQDLAACGGSIKTSASGAKGRAAAKIAEGLTEAWSGNLDDAVSAFDAALTAYPKSALAYLNRGMALAHSGDLPRALDDLDRAVRYAPHDAKGYYQRSRVLEQIGDQRRARADADRAIEIDPAYRAAIHQFSTR